MIEVVLSDGTRRMLNEAEVAMKWKAKEDDSAESSYTFDEVKVMLLYGPNLSTMAGMFRGMPIMGMAFTDDSGLRVEVPVPLGFANDLGTQLVKDTDRYAAQVKAAGGDTKKALQRYQSLPADLPPAPGMRPRTRPSS